MPRWLVSVSYEAATADDARDLRDYIAGTLADFDAPTFTVSDVVGVPTEDEPTTHANPLRERQHHG